MKTHFVYKRIPHHASHSGYDQLAKYIPCKEFSVTFGNIITTVLERLPERHVQPWLKAETGGWYKKQLLAQEVQVALSMAIHVPFCRAVYHYLYGEDAFRWGGSIPWKAGNKIVVTFHQPPSVFDEVIKDKSFIAKADALIVCGTNQVAYFERITGRNNVYFIPHGVDTVYFAPPVEKKTRRFNAISVGWWLRDVDMIRRVIERASEKSLDMEFNIVTFPEYYEHYKGLRNVNLFSGISDEDLKKKYQEADALLLPMKDCTANNAVLEAMACGVPVLTSDNGGMRDYVDESCGFLARPGDDCYLFEAISDLMVHPDKRKRMGEAARKKALEFDWKRVAQRMMNVYTAIWSA